MELVLVWLENSKIENEGALVFELTTSHKHSVLRMLFKDPNFSKEMKLAVLEKTLGDDKSDPAEKTRIKCMSGLPDAESKEAAWLAITDVNSKESIAEREAKMSGFFSWNQLELNRPYFDKFYEVLKDMNTYLPFKYL